MLQFRHHMLVFTKMYNLRKLLIFKKFITRIKSKKLKYIKSSQPFSFLEKISNRISELPHLVLLQQLICPRTKKRLREKKDILYCTNMEFKKLGK